MTRCINLMLSDMFTILSRYFSTQDLKFQTCIRSSIKTSRYLYLVDKLQKKSLWQTCFKIIFTLDVNFSFQFSSVKLVYH